MDWIDSHAHLETFHRKGELEGVLERAEAAGVREIITIGTSQKDWKLYQQLAAAHPGRIHFTVGLHPSDVEDDFEDQIAQIGAFFAEEPRPVAIGECGLDHSRLPKYPDEAAEVRSRQEQAFRLQLELAVQFDLPVVVHSRNAFADCVRVIDESAMDWAAVVFHCFAEGAEEIRELNTRGGRGSFTGIATYPKAPEVREALKEQGVALAMVETDAPYLAPQSRRGETNEPAFVAETGQRCAGELGLPPEDFAARTTANARAFFGLGGG